MSVFTPGNFADLTGERAATARMAKEGQQEECENDGGGAEGQLDQVVGVPGQDWVSQVC